MIPKTSLSSWKYWLDRHNLQKIRTDEKKESEEEEEIKDESDEDFMDIEQKKPEVKPEIKKVMAPKKSASPPIAAPAKRKVAC